MNKYFSCFVFLLLITVSCTDDDSFVNNRNVDSTADNDYTIVEGNLHDAFSEFSDDITIVLTSDDTVVIEADGLPNHTSPYWSTTHDLYVDPTVADPNHMSPGNIDDFSGSYELEVSVSPQKASTTTSTSLGALGIATSGAVIFNNNEAGNVQITETVASGLDFNGAHSGPTGYHYHFEPTSISDDDDNLVGIIADGFFIYGRKCFSTGSYPEDLDDSNGHTTTTQHNESEEYHYHVSQTTIYGEYYLNFPGDYQGTPSSIN